MFVVYCATCDRRTLMGIDEVEWVYNLTPGVISVAGNCPHGHPVVVLTGDSFTPRADPRTPPYQLSPWARAYRHRWWSQMARRLRGRRRHGQTA
ncbi:hypothetical protein [Amycolatopsis taiwanensis]|uniref:hypothetical protein n=1 Tax=Amycolatopsis taiwanensis TaxID=342230 RepID=UPI0004ACA372|nr:hypothetical protein [Amycolatopsis taiwanensis]